MTDHILVQRSSPLMLLTLNRPEKLNAISDAMLDELKAAIASFTADRD